ncbi:LpxI family protein [Parvularcula maris]|uniref:UDP-2,3-diacylglucosamine diphosphatase LpxI n=1 Tax=Parvularcula maris TaxID=2965077 RepID=A0A9X2L9J6_9PROT|nr:UDP-2,3-diacylglucosamine diphosphatase LpxI [Parvularcula maris]MCQ8185547.1 UDP-2,3-diacylglucosamine diphosphatase LpxI [Parvularcula maris]
MPAGPVAAAGWQRLGIVAGSGDLPIRIADAEIEAGRKPFFCALTEEAPPERFEQMRAGVGEVGGVIRGLKKAGCDAVCFAGHVLRPNLAKLRLDWGGMRLLPKVAAAARRGDGAILDVMVESFEQAGFRVIGAHEAAGSLSMPSGAIGRTEPSAEDLADIEKGAAIVKALGPFDVAQGVVVRRGFVLAVEAAEGTDRMLARVAELPDTLKGGEPGEKSVRSGVLVKMPKPGQELRVDLPTIGPATVRHVHAAGLKGIAVGAGLALLVDREETLRLADELGLYVYGVSSVEEA